MKATLNCAELKRLIRATKDFVQICDTNCEAHSYIRLELSAEDRKITAVAIDGTRVSIETTQAVDIDADFICYIKGNIPNGNKFDIAEIRLEGDYCYVTVNGVTVGYEQPDSDFFDYKTYVERLSRSKPAAAIILSRKLLRDAMQSISPSAKRDVVTVEVRGDLEPMVIRTANGARYILPCSK